MPKSTSTSTRRNYQTDLAAVISRLLATFIFPKHPIYKVHMNYIGIIFDAEDGYDMYPDDMYPDEPMDIPYIKMLQVLPDDHPDLAASQDRTECLRYRLISSICCQYSESDLAVMKLAMGQNSDNELTIGKPPDFLIRVLSIEQMTG
jgi:hypothetical protein